MRLAHALDRLPVWAWLLLAAAGAGASFRLGLDLEAGSSAGAGAPTTSGRSAAPGSLRDYRVRLADGRVTTLATPGEPAVVMVSSVSCAVCAAAMRDFGRQAGGKAPPRLRIVTLEGAAEGEPMLARYGLSGAWHAGPADGAGQTLLTFQFPGTPTFLLVDAEGAVRAALPGYPGREAFAAWWRVAAGERTTL